MFDQYVTDVYAPAIKAGPGLVQRIKDTMDRCLNYSPPAGLGSSWTAMCRQCIQKAVKKPYKTKFEARGKPRSGNVIRHYRKFHPLECEAVGIALASAAASKQLPIVKSLSIPGSSSGAGGEESGGYFPIFGLGGAANCSTGSPQSLAIADALLALVINNGLPMAFLDYPEVQR
jgi:hypothetical protein